MKDTEPLETVGLPDAGGLNIDYGETITIEPTEDQLRQLRSDLKTIADSVRTHMTHRFTVTPQINRSQEGLQGRIRVVFPSGDTIVPVIPITADRFDGEDQPDWNGPIPPEEVETLSREITMATVSQWAKILEQVGGGQALPAS